MAVTAQRRQRQLDYNRDHGITPRSVQRAVEQSLAVYQSTREEAAGILKDSKLDLDYTATLQELEAGMVQAAADLEFEKAALLRDQIKELKHLVNGDPAPKKAAGVQYRKPRRSRK